MTLLYRRCLIGLGSGEISGLRAEIIRGPRLSRGQKLKLTHYQHLVDLPSALNRLLATNFRVSRPLVADLRAEAADRKRQGD